MIYLVTANVEFLESKYYKTCSISESIIMLRNLEEIGLDTETEGLDRFTKKLLLLQLGCKNFQIVYDIKSFGYIIPKQLKDFLNSYNGLFILQNAKFDLQFLFVQGIFIKKVYDTMLAEQILTNGLDESCSLKTIALKYCNVELDKTVRGKIIKMELNTEIIIYSAEDVAHLSDIKAKQMRHIDRLHLNVALNIDNAFVIVLAYIEYCGIKLDWDKWKNLSIKHLSELQELKTQLGDMLWKDGKFKYFSGMQDLFSGFQDCIVNWNSSKQLITLFNEYGINTTIHEKGEEKQSIDAKVLEPQEKQFPIVALYLKYSKKQKECSTYGLNWEQYINKATGRIHTTYHQLGAATGRLSSGSRTDNLPNMQNIPTGEYRECFVPEKGNVIIDCDYSGQESVILANESKEPNLINFFKRGLGDLHSYVAFLIYPEVRNCSLEHITEENLSYIKKNFKDKRQIAKSAEFAIAYGGNGQTIAKNCNIPTKEGEDVYNSYFEAFPDMKNFFDLAFAQSDHFGYITFNSVSKRKYFFNPVTNDYFKYREEVEDPYFWQSNPEARSIFRKYSKAKGEVARYSQNFKIQGTAADITKYAGIFFMREIFKRNWFGIVKIVAAVHDEYVIECPESMVDEVSKCIEDCMKLGADPFCKLVPLGAEAIHGDHWVH